MSMPVRILALALLLLPRISTAGPLEVTVVEPLGLDFGPWGADFSSSGFDDIFMDGVPRTAPSSNSSIYNNFSGEVEFHAGPRESLTLSGDADRTYSLSTYGPGTLTLTAHWLDKSGGATQGAFVAPLLSLSVDLCEQDLSPSGCFDVFGESQGSVFAIFGVGLFDDNLAHALRIGRAGDIGTFGFDIDGVSGDPSSNFRISGSPSGHETLEIGVTVPEPSVLSLFLLSSIAAFTWARIRRRAAR